MKKSILALLAVLTGAQVVLANPPSLNFTGRLDGTGLSCGAVTSEDGAALRFTYEHENGEVYQIDLNWDESSRAWTYDSKLRGSRTMFMYAPAESCFVAVTPIMGEDSQMSALKYETVNQVQATACSLFPLPWFNSESFSAICRVK